MLPYWIGFVYQLDNVGYQNISLKSYRCTSTLFGPKVIHKLVLEFVFASYIYIYRCKDDY